MKDFLLKHGFYSGMSKKKERAMLKELANLSAYVDIDERTSGSVGKFYDLFDGSNNHSTGQIDTSKITKTGLTSGQNIINVSIDEANKFKTGQEVTIQDDTKIERKILNDVNLNKVSETYDVTTPTQIVDKDLFTSRNNARKLVMTSNGILHAVSNDSTSLYYFISSDNGQTWQNKNIRYFTGIDSISVVTNGDYVYVLVLCDTIYVKLYIYSNDGSYIKGYTIDATDTNVSSCSLAINKSCDEIHACWCFSNPIYSSVNIKYVKCIIQPDCNILTNNIIQLTSANMVGLNCGSPVIIVQNNIPRVMCILSGADVNDIRLFKFDENGFMNTYINISSYGSYVQQQLSAIYVPKEINGLTQGRIYITWCGTDGVDNSVSNIKVSYSDDVGVTWHTTKLTSGNSYAQYNPSITANKNNEVFILYNGTDEHDGFHDIKMLKGVNGLFGDSVKIIEGTIGSVANSSTMYDVNLDFEIPLFIYTNVQKHNISFCGKWTKTTYNPQLTLSAPLENNYTDNAMIYRSNYIVENNKLKIGKYKNTIVNDVRENTITKAPTFSTEGSGGRKLVRLENGWLIFATKNTTDNYLYFYKSEDNGVTWTQLTKNTFTTVGTSSKCVAITSYKNNVYVIHASSGMVYFGYFNATTVESSVKLISTMFADMRACGGVSIAINNNGNKIHICWSALGQTSYNSQFNLTYRYITLNQDGSINLICNEERLTTSTDTSISSPCIVLSAYGDTINIFCEYNGTSEKGILEITTKTPTKYAHICTHSSFGDVWVYKNSTSTQYNPSAIYIPQKINGLPQGRIYVSWYGEDSTVNNKSNIKVSYSDDYGLTWSTATRITDSGTHRQYNPSITVNALGVVFLLWNGSDINNDKVNIKCIQYADNKWGNLTNITNLLSDSCVMPSTLFDCELDFETPLFVYTEASSNNIKYTGKLLTHITKDLSESDVRYNVNPSSQIKDIVTWIEKEDGLNINVKSSMQNNSTSLVESKEQFVDMIETQANEYIQSFAVKDNATVRLNLTGDNTKGVTKLLGAVGV